MPKSATKRGSKASSQPMKPLATKPSPPTTTRPPAPYSTPPPVLAPFLSTLNASHIYIIHLDPHPWEFKRRIFAVPVLMNIAITILLLWRMRVALPTYASLLLTVLGHDSSATINPKVLGWAALLQIGGRRWITFFIDWILAVYLVSWPLDFFIGSPSSPISWRLKVGFQNQEIIVRKSRKWDQELAKDWLAEDADGSVYQDRIMPAIQKTYVQKTGYLLMDKNWNLDFAAMISAHTLVSSGKADFPDFRKQVIVYSDDHGWLVWPVWKLDESSSTQEEEGRKKIMLFKDKLTEMGKENLFFSWIELISSEAEKPGGFTPERQADALKKAKELFESQGVDFERFWKEVGGLEGLPGMPVSTTIGL